MEGIPDVCRSRGSARAWLSTAPRLRTDGAVEWREVTCRRQTREWTCERPEHRQRIWVYAEVDGVLRRLEVSFDEATGLARARVRAVQTMHIIQDPASAPISACGRMNERWERTGWARMNSETRGAFSTGGKIGDSAGYP